MATTVNVNQNNNTVTLDDQNRGITVTDNKTSTTVNISQPVTRIVTVSTIGPQGPKGNTGDIGTTGERSSGSVDWSLITNVPDFIDFEGEIAPNQLAIFTDTFGNGLPVNLPFSLPIEFEGDGVPTVKGLSGLTYDGSTFNVEGTVSTDDLILNYDTLPTSDPRVRGQVWRSGTDLKISAG